jgi:hypothetical protein
MQAFGRSAPPLEATDIELIVKLARQSLLRAPERTIAELESIDESSAPDLQLATACTITVSAPYQIAGIRAMLAERTGIQLPDIVLVAQGKALSDNSVLPRACYADSIQAPELEDRDEALLDVDNHDTLWLIDMSDEPESAVTATEAENDDVPTTSNHSLGSSKSFFGSALMVTVKQPSTVAADSAANSSDEHSDDDAAWTYNDEAITAASTVAVPTAAAAANEQQLQLEVARSIENFDIVKELQSIDCKQYAELFIQAGYSQRGAFAAVTDADLAGDPLYLHVSARKRILTLAASTARAIELEYGGVKTVLQEVAANADKFTLDGVTYYTTKREMMAAVAQQQSSGASSVLTAAARRRKDSSSSSSGVRTKTVTAEQRALVGSIVAAEQQPAARSSCVYAHIEGCCSKHNYAREQCWPDIIATWLKNAMFTVEASLRAADSSGTGFVPRQTLLSIIQQALLSNDLAYHETEANCILQAAALPHQSPYLYDLGTFKRCLQAVLSRGLHLRSGMPPPAAALTPSAQQ